LYEDDPADPEFDTPVVVMPRPINTTLLREELGSDPVAVELLETTNQCHAFLAAALRAYERSLGAAEVADRFALDARVAEAKTFKEASVQYLKALAEQAQTFASRLDEIIGDRRVGRHGPPPRHVSELPVDTLAYLYRAGVRLQDLTQALLVIRSVEEASLEPETFRDLGEASGEFAVALRDWDPAP
jgi:hypothetical protein